MNTLTLLQIAANIAVILYTGDELRRIIGHRHLLIVLSCVLVCAGALGGICEAVRHGTTVYNLSLSLGVAIYCAHRHRHRGVQP
jgi:membrane associated rhomboid family serine protease